jgi:hypothetical protein
MPKMFIKFTDKKTKKKYFVGWSTITDCVNTDVMDSETFKKTVTLTDEKAKNKNTLALPSLWQRQC